MQFTESGMTTSRNNICQQFIPQYDPQESLLRAYCEENPLPKTPPSLPDPWPRAPGAMAWKGDDLKQDYITSLSTEQLKQISDACNVYHGQYFESPRPIIN